MSNAVLLSSLVHPAGSHCILPWQILHQNLLTGVQEDDIAADFVYILIFQAS